MPQNSPFGNGPKDARPERRNSPDHRIRPLKIAAATAQAAAMSDDWILDRVPGESDADYAESTWRPSRRDRGFMR